MSIEYLISIETFLLFHTGIINQKAAVILAMKHVFKNYLYNLLYQLLSMILPVLTTPYIVRVLQPDGLGQYNYSFSIISVILIFAQLGTNLYGQREIAYHQNDIEIRSRVFWEVIFIRLISSMAMMLVYIYIALKLVEYTYLLLWMSLYIVSNIFDISWFYQGIENFRKIALRNILVKCTGAVLIFVFVNDPSDLILYTVILALSQVTGNLAMLVGVKKLIIHPSLHSLNVKRHLKPIIELFLPTVAVYVYTYVDKIFLGMLSTNLQVAYYSQAEKIIKMLMTILTSLGTVLLPHIATTITQKERSQIYNEISKAVASVLSLGLPMSIGVLFLSSRFIPWFLGESYIESIPIFSLLSPLIVVIGLASITGQAVLIPFSLQKEYSLSIFFGATVNVILNTILIPSFAGIGAAVGTVAAEVIVTSIQGYFVYKFANVNVFSILLQNWEIVLSTTLMGTLLFIESKTLPFDHISMLVMIMTGLLAYSLSFLLLKILHRKMTCLNI